MTARAPAGGRPRVSVLLPCRDAAEHLPACIESLSAQTLGAFEVLAVDDGSRDGTRELLEGWRRRDGRVRVVEGGSGLVPALRRAAGAARAPLLARMDADDVARPERLERQAEALAERRGLAALGCGVRYVPPPEAGEGYRRYERWLNGLRTPGDLARDLFVECPIAHPTLMIRRSAYRALGGYRDAGWPEDYDLVLRLHRAGMRAANLPEVLLDWRLRPESRSRVHPAYREEAFLRCKVHHLTEGFLPPDRPLVVWGAGRRGKPLALELGAAGRPPEAFVELDPGKIGQRIHGAEVLDPESFRRRYPDPGDAYVLGAVGTPGARKEIRAALGASGRSELDDFRMLA